MDRIQKLQIERKYRYRKIEIVRHINDVITGIALLILIGIVGSWDIGDITEGQFITFVATTVYIISYCILRWKISFERE